MSFIPPSLALANLLGVAYGLPTLIATENNIVNVSGTTPAQAGVPLLGFVSYSIEFAFFPEYAGNTSHPNVFSNNLLNNIGNLTGTKPYIRVGGNTQDYAIFNSSLTDAALIGIYEPTISTDYPLEITFGPEFFSSYRTWPDTQFIHGFNLAKNSSADRIALIESASYACRALSDGRLAFWELGNEPDLYKTSSQGIKRPATWDEADYVHEWLNLTTQLRAAMEDPCPTLADYKYYAPSFAGVSLNLNPITAWEDGLDKNNNIGIISSHNYINGATSPGVTLQHTLMNHTANVVSISHQFNELRLLAAEPYSIDPNLQFIMGETNSLYNEGRPGLSNTFGAALWGVDFNLWCATNNISRVHMHQGLNYRYQSWQPIDTNITSKGTKPPYYGNIAVAAFMGDLTKTKPEIVNLPLTRDEESAYAAYVDGKLDRIMIINLMEYNATVGNDYIDNYPRPSQRYEFQLPMAYAGKADVQWLIANGSDAVTGITFDGYSYNYELDNGMPVRLDNVTIGQRIEVRNGGKMALEVPWSSAAIVRFNTA